jgi:hypothetical protein
VARKPVDEDTLNEAGEVPVEAAEQNPAEPVEMFVTPGAGLRSLRARIESGPKRGTVRLTRALTLLEAEYERVSKGVAPAADDSGPKE